MFAQVLRKINARFRFTLPLPEKSFIQTDCPLDKPAVQGARTFLNMRILFSRNRIFNGEVGVVHFPFPDLVNPYSLIFR